MTTSIDMGAVDRGTDRLLDLLTPDQVSQLSHLEPDAELEQRITTLARRADEGELTPEERAEYEGYVEANGVLAVLRAAARHRLARRGVELMDTGIRQAVSQRANGMCEYCGLHEEDSPLSRHQIEHIVPLKHGGTDDLSNLALACIACNLYKGPNLSGIDPDTGELSPLFDARRHTWREHFQRDGLSIAGTTAIGRTTVVVLRLNDPAQLRLRLAAER